MKQRFHHGLFVVAFCLLAATAIAQRVFLPNGLPVTEPVEVRVESDDGIFRETFYTDSKGRLILKGVGGNKSYTATVIGDGKNYDTTRVRFQPGIGSLEIHLQPIEGFVARPKGGTVAVGDLREPLPKALQMHEEGLDLLRDNKFDAAERKFQSAILADPEFSAPYNDLAAIYITKRRYADAEHVASEGLRKNAQSTRLLYNQGTALNYLGRYEEAKTPLRAALRKLPNWTNAEAQLGIALLETDQLAAAKPCLERGINADGIDQSFAFLYLGKLHATQGTFAEAVYAWEEFLKLDSKSPNAAQVKNVLEQIRPKATGKVTQIQPSGACQ